MNFAELSTAFSGSSLAVMLLLLWRVQALESTVKKNSALTVRVAGRLNHVLGKAGHEPLDMEGE